MYRSWTLTVVSVLIVCSIDEPAPARRLHTEMLLCVTHSVQAVMSYSVIQNVKCAADRVNNTDIRQKKLLEPTTR